MTTVDRSRTTRVVVPAQPDPGLWTEDPEIFRFPAPDDPPPGTGRILMIAVYGAGLGLCGVGVGLYAVMAVFSGAPAWYLPVLALLTMMSVAPVVAAFLAIHQRILPWFLLLGGAPPMAAAVMVALSH